MPGFVTSGLVHRTPCPTAGCKWEWRELGACAAVGAFAVQRHCPKCKRDFLLIFRINRYPESDIPLRIRLLDRIPMRGLDSEGIRARLFRVIGLNEEDVELLMWIFEQQPVPA